MEREVNTFSITNVDLLDTSRKKEGPPIVDSLTPTFSLKDLEKLPPPPDQEDDLPLGSDPTQAQDYLRERSGPALPPNLGETFLTSVAKTKEGLTSIYLRSRLQGVRSHLKTMETTPGLGTPERMGELKAEEMELLEDMLQAQDLYSTYTKYERAFTPKNESLGAEIIRSTVASSPTVLAGIGGYAFGGPTGAMLAGTSAGAAQTFVDSYHKAAKTLPHDAAVGYALEDSFVEALGDKLMIGAATKEGKRILDRFIGAAVTGMAEEGAAQALQSFHEYVELNPKMTLKEAMHDFVVALGSGALMGTGMAAGSVGVEQISQVVQEKRAETELRSLQEKIFSDALAEMNTRLESPEETAIRLLNPGIAEKRPVNEFRNDYGFANIGGPPGSAGTVAPQGVPTFHDPSVPVLPQAPVVATPPQGPITFDLDTDAPSTAYGAIKIGMEMDPVASLARLVQTNPEAAAEWTLGNQALFSGPDVPTPVDYVLDLVTKGLVTPQQQEAYVNLLQEKINEEAEAAASGKKEQLLKRIEDRANKLSKRLNDQKFMPMFPEESAELNLLSSSKMDELVRASKYRETEKVLQDIVAGAPKTSVSYFLAQQILAKRLSDPKPIAVEAFMKRRAQLEEISVTGLPPQFGNPAANVKEKGYDPDVYPSEVASGYTPQQLKTSKGLIEVAPGLKHAKMLEDVAKRWVKLFKLEDINVIVLGTEPGALERGSHLFWEDPATGQVTFQIRVSGELGPELLIEVYAHEFGHGIGPIFYRNSPPEIRQAIQLDYASKVRLMAKQTTDEVLKGIHSPGLANEKRYPGLYNEKLAENMLQAWEVGQNPFARGGGYSGPSNYWSNYIPSFEEYFAQSVSRAFARDFAGMQTSVKGFIMQLLGSLKKLYADYKKYAPDDRTFKLFLEYHRAQAELRGIESRKETVQRALGILATPGGKGNLPVKPLSAVQDVTKVVLKTPLRTPIPSQLENASVGPPPKGPPRLRNFINKKLGIDEDISGLDGDLDAFSWIKRLFGNLIILARDNPHIKELSDPSGTINGLTGQKQWGYLELAQFYAQERMKWIQRADERAKEWNGLTGKEKTNLAEILYEETLNKRFFTPQEVFQRLGPEATKVFFGVRQDFQSFLQEMETTAVAKAQARWAGDISLPGRIQAIRDNFGKLKQHPYFPLARFGKHLLIVRATQDDPVTGVKAGQLLWFESFDYGWQAKKAYAGVKKQFPGEEIKLDETNDLERSMAGIPPQVWEVIRGDLNLTPEQDQRLNDLIYKMAPEQRFVKHLIKRKNTPGFSQDALRAYAHYFLNASGHMARTKWGDQMHDASNRLRASANEVTGDATARRRISNYVARHLDYTFNPGSEWAGLRATVAVLYLWGMLRTAVTNLTQVPMFTLPHLAAKYGDKEAMAALAKAYRLVPSTATGTRKLNSQEMAALDKHSQGAALTPREQRFVDIFYGISLQQRTALERGVREGFLDESFAMVLAGLANGNMLSRLKATSQVGYYARTMAWAGMVPFEAAEKLNRRVTFMAAYNLEMESQKKAGANAAVAEEAAFQAGKIAVQQTQFEYSRWNRPELLRGKPGAMLLFMQYQFNALSFMMGGDKGWWRAWAVMFLFGGLLGLPFAEDLERLASWLLSSKNKKVDVKHELRKFTKEVLGDYGSLLDHGISSFGFGLPFLGDMSGSVSLGRVIPGMHMLGETQDFNTGLARGMGDLGGATTSLALSMLRGLSEEELPFWKRMELVNPLAVGDRILQSARWLQKGREESAGGRLITEFDTGDWRHLVEIGANVGGFTPRAVSLGEEGRGPGREEFYLRQDMVQFYMARQRALRKAYVEAAVARDFDEMRKAREEIRKFNDEVPSSRLRILGTSLGAAVRQKLKNRSLDERTGEINRLERGVEDALQNN